MIGVQQNIPIWQIGKIWGSVILYLILSDVDSGAVVEESGDLSDGIIVERRLEVLGNVDDDRRGQARDDVAAMKEHTSMNGTSLI